MSSYYSNDYQNQLIIRNENIRYALMFILFTLLAFLSSLLLFFFVYTKSEQDFNLFNEYFLPYSILASISSALFLIFFIGALVYTSKSLTSISQRGLSQLPTDV